MSTKIIYVDTDDSTSETDLDNLDNTDNEQEVEDESNPWASLKTEVAEKIWQDLGVMAELYCR